MTTLETLIGELQASAAERGVRALLLVEMPRDEVPPAAPLVDRADRLAARLGTETWRLLHDARGVPDPALLAAEIGTLVVGGLLVLLTDPAGTYATRSATRFARHLEHLLVAMPDTSARIALPSSDQASLRGLCSMRRESGSFPLDAPPDTIAAQDACLERIVAHLHLADTADTATLITAARGRGKSALAGRLAAHLQRCGVAYTVTAAHRSATDVLERHRLLTLSDDPTAFPGPLPFVAPDAALRARGEALIVDEAASLPLPSIETLLARYRHVVLASTSEGHESAGRAFALQLPAMLERTRAGAWLSVAPSEPIRWRDGDPLETFVSRTLLSGAAAGDIVTAGDVPADASSPCPAARRIDHDALADDEPRLSAVFGLLSATHYQSSPVDLVHLLDSPALRLWTVERGTAMLGVALVAIERGPPPELHADVLARRRRPPHCLLPQLLAQCADDALALDATFARVVRIAVHPDARRRGLGSRLVEAIVRDTAEEVEAVGASFGARDASLAFWRSNGFRRFHLGHSRNARSGVRSAAVLRAGSARSARVLAEAIDLHRDNTSAGVSTRTGPLAGDSPALLPEYDGRPGRDDSGDDPVEADSIDVDERRDLRLLRRFVAGERSVADTRGALSRLANRDERSVAVSSDAGGPAVVNGTAGGARRRRRDEGRAGEAAADDTTRLLVAFGAPVPSSRRDRERALRAAVRTRLPR